MRFNYTLLSILVILISISLPIGGKRVLMLPLSPREVYKLLKEAGREDAIPQGRVVTQGIAAVSGFALGLAKGIGGTILGAAALSSLNLAGSSCSSSSCNQQQTQEVCFTSRSLNEIYDSEEDDVPQGRQATTTGTATGTGTVTGTGTGTTTNTLTSIPTTATTTNTAPTTATVISTPATGTATNGGTNTIVNTGTGTGTQSGTTTQTGTGGAVNCVVIKQPAASTQNSFG